MFYLTEWVEWIKSTLRMVVSELPGNSPRGNFTFQNIFISWPRKIKKRMERSLSISSSFSFNRLNDCVDEAVIMMPTSNFRMPSLTDPQDSPAERKSSSAGSSASRTEREVPEALVGQQMPILGGQEKMWHVCRSSWDFRFLLGLSIVDMPELGCDSATGHQIKKKMHRTQLLL